MSSAISHSNKTTQTDGPYRVMVVDDSAIIRGFLCRYLSEDPNIDVVTTANNGSVALRQLDLHDVEVVVLDIEMPVMDGLTALPKMMDKKPDLQVVMASTLTRKNAEVSLRSLQMGAVDYVPKPETARSVNANIDFRRELVEKVKAWASRRRTKINRASPALAGSVISGSTPAPRDGFVKPSRPQAPTGFVSAARPRPAPVISSVRAATATNINSDAANDTKLSLRKGSLRRPKILLIGSSTGGPQALMKFFAGFSKRPDVPILITQHMPATFTAILADHLKQATGWDAEEAKDSTALMPGHIYVAPGGKHMEIVEENGKIITRLTDDPPENFCKPAVDPMFRSAARIYKDQILAVMLTGMGHDGLKGSREITKEGATLLAQDEETSVVWGMPGAVATAGLCTEILPITELGAAASKRLQGAMM
ncbi:protein-glutamate methylesterase/protein-glutamine glutaminase [Kordiimonas aquimaris]|uniref:protein-glutamate methylesterase/protein-glutamine glutaminase n=1 Tax=Kordiimonas aquimaris TaxID=707591 RepID=UPI0021CDF8F0|nr:chemotaxis response regulator protein-glutamate methylesterase [Kordiimonas aquimaris]